MDQHRPEPWPAGRSHRATTSCTRVGIAPDHGDRDSAGAGVRRDGSGGGPPARQRQASATDARWAAIMVDHHRNGIELTDLALQKSRNAGVRGWQQTPSGTSSPSCRSCSTWRRRAAWARCSRSRRCGGSTSRTCTSSAHCLVRSSTGCGWTCFLPSHVRDHGVRRSIGRHRRGESPAAATPDRRRAVVAGGRMNDLRGQD